MKRLYKLVSIAHDNDAFSIRLDDRPVKTPGGKILSVQSNDLAHLLLQEWSAQEEKVDPKTMPVNQIVMTTLDGIKSKDDSIAHILDYIDTDLVAFHSDVDPYQSKQNEIWGRWIDWVEGSFGVQFQTTQAIAAIAQEDAFRSHVKSYLETLDMTYLTLFESLIEDTSSVVLSLAMFEGQATADDIYNAVFLEDLIRAEIYDEEKYGAAPDQIKKRALVLRNLQAAQALIALRTNS